MADLTNPNEQLLTYQSTSMPAFGVESGGILEMVGVGGIGGDFGVGVLVGAVVNLLLISQAQIHQLILLAHLVLFPQCFV